MSNYPHLVPQPVAAKYEALLAEAPEQKRGEKDQLCRIYIEGKRTGTTHLCGNSGPQLLQLLRWAESMGWGADTVVKVFRYGKASGTDSYLADEFTVAQMVSAPNAPAPSAPTPKKVKVKAKAKLTQGNLFEMEVAHD